MVLGLFNSRRVFKWMIFYSHLFCFIHTKSLKRVYGQDVVPVVYASRVPINTDQ